MPLARSLVWCLRTSQESRDDLVQVACMGLVHSLVIPRRGRPFHRHGRMVIPNAAWQPTRRLAVSHVSPAVGVGLICALLSALGTNLAFLFKHRGALAAPI
jgi:hypothetical protein